MLLLVLWAKVEQKLLNNGWWPITFVAFVVWTVLNLPSKKSKRLLVVSRSAHLDH